MIFQESGLEDTCQECLEKMFTASDRLMSLRHGDHSLRRRYEEHRQRWTRLISNIEDLHISLQQLPEKWQQYNDRLDLITRLGVSDVMVTMTDKIKWRNGCYMELKWGSPCFDSLWQESILL